MANQDGMIRCPAPAVDHLERHGYLFGFPIAHSLSPLLHQTIYNRLGLDWDYLPLPSTDMKHFLELVRDPRCYGSSVTMPHKVSILQHLDEITPECKAVGACNTIFRRGSQLVGTNTDTIGVREAFFQNIASPDQVYRGRPGLVIGGGGAARSAVYALTTYLECETIYLVNRDPAEVEAVISWCNSQGYGQGLRHVTSVAEAESLEGPGAIVACVPNFPPSTPAERDVRSMAEAFLAKPHKGAMLEMCYHPTVNTELGRLAEAAGWKVILGTEAMIYQGLEQDRYWTGRATSELPVEEVKRVVAAELNEAHL